MARYTLNLSEICEQVSGLKFNDMEGMAFDRIDTIANAAIPNLFSTRYNLLDDGDDLNDLQRMILEHYWEYEVCAYTPSDFILRLNRKLNEIAPLYNQRYESTKLEFPVFEDIDYSEDGTDSHENHGTTEGTGNTKHSDQDVMTSAHTGTIDVEKQESGTTKTDTTLDGEQKHGGTVGVQNTEGGTTKVVTDHTETDLGHDVTTAQRHQDNTDNESMETRKTDWDYKNDTPQSSISGITEQDYLSSYSKHTSENEAQHLGLSSSMSGSYFDGSTYSMNASDSGMPAADKFDSTKNYGINDQKTHSAGSTDVDDTSTTTHGRTNQQTTTYNDKVETDNTTNQTVTHGKGDEQTTTYGDTTTNTTEYGHNIATENESKNDLTHEGEYHKEAKGKYNSGKSYAQMLMEYREAMINIYDEIIKELRELFFIIY